MGGGKTFLNNYKAREDEPKDIQGRLSHSCPISAIPTLMGVGPTFWVKNSKNRFSRNNLAIFWLSVKNHIFCWLKAMHKTLATKLGPIIVHSSGL